MRSLILALVCGLLLGCEYTVPLVSSPSVDIDRALLGVWQRTKPDSQSESLLVLPLSKVEYLVSLPAGARDAMFAKACLCRVDNRTLVQLQWFGTARGNLPETNRVFQFASYAVDGDTLTVRLLNSEVVARDAASPDALTKAIIAGRGKPDLFREAAVYTRTRVREP